ncbi:MAG: GMC family oxidoreductase N-terminal domain-containing protein [Yaniella sp.]|uniref:GMC family oxidoreductase n=2 Tax=Yaniella sp. TaxID=2773929 RepID=UPI0026492449|nr:GMC family oxidoreductase N-terminal domain-containing protein [Yaniella sp.]MDN5731415.1 GMC family oxidoreductase N-terminal domain-containing protein [Yaniella sp.]MDN5819055.1 GMC family oxidoreductase N-terminal domain-containing protein [Yaniella sp.]MDN5912999.1 GMC family oxidoreductase N-terminal domain-containing protein [Yaniella sp.]MDN6456929.1 GMC family oxidoreductase N-terminal domain-containing protein [Yaniella sp.]MDN6758264.1 GMC family oxidoreductase N-terminal domain-c
MASNKSAFFPTETPTETFDYIVVGAGSAGCVLARRLVDAGKRVCVVEAGDDETNPNIDHLNDLGLLWHSEQDWDYYTTPQPGAMNRKIHLPRGKVLGGSNALNAVIWVRGAAWDYQQWVELGCPGWSWDEVWPVFREIENYDGDMSQTRGQHGPMDVRINYSRNSIQEDMVAAAEQTNLTYNEDYNSGDVEGVSRIQLNVRDGKRLNTWRAYLKPILGDPHLTVLTAAHARRLLIEDGNNVTGVEIDHRGRIARLQANEVVLTAGALASPELLLRSGVGPSADLREVGIEVVHDLAEVGKNLQDHWLSPVIFTTNAQPVPTGEVAPAEVHLFWKSRPDLPVADTQPLFFSVPMYAQDSAPNIQSGPDNGFTLQGGLVRPQSRGEVRLSGPNPEDPLLIDPNVLSEQQDVDALVASVKQCREIGRAEALAGWEPKEIFPGPDVADEDLEDYVRGSVVTYHHQVGTCRMGQDESAVVDPVTFRVHGLDGVRIADASVMPLIPTGNTNAPTIMIAERAAAALTRSVDDMAAS